MMQRLSRLLPWLWLGLLWATASLWPGIAATQSVSGAADEVKAAYLYRFVAYIEWPETAFATRDGPLVIGVAGADPLMAELSRALAGRSAHGRPLVARRLAAGDPTEGVHMLYVGDAAMLRSPWVQRLRDRPMLIVSESPQGLENGSALNFVLVDDRLRFEASLRATERAGLKVSSRLLALAQRIVGGSP
jgi:hypothetical protein